jgi:hypothetical protein
MTFDRISVLILFCQAQGWAWEGLLLNCTEPNPHWKEERKYGSTGWIRQAVMSKALGWEGLWGFWRGNGVVIWGSPESCHRASFDLSHLGIFLSAIPSSCHG